MMRTQGKPPTVIGRLADRLIDRLRRASRHESHQLLALHRASVVLAAESDPDTVLRHTLQSAVTLLGAGSGTLYRWDADVGILRCAHNWRVPEADTTPDQRPGEGLAGHVFLRGKPLIVNDYLGWRYAMASGRAAGLRAALSVPLLRSGNTLGVIVIRSYDNTLFTDDDCRLLSLFADQAAVTVENTLVYAAARQELAERRRAETALHENEARLRAVIADAPIVLFAVDRQGVLTLADGRGLLTLGLHAATLVGRHHDASRGRFPSTDEGIARALDGDVSSSTSTLAGRIFETQYTPLRDEEGAITGIIGVATDVTERRAFQARLEHQAFHDPLTNLPNRAHFMEQLTRALARKRGDLRADAVVFLDLDGFKHVNDSLGHASGDRLLIGVAERLRATVHPDNVVARFGGDEFVILLRGTAEDDAAPMAAERLLAALREPFRIDNAELHIGASLGIAPVPDHRASPQDLLRYADIALYRAKGRGKGCYELFDPTMNTQARERLTLEADLRRAIGRDEFVLHYQPQIALQTGQVVGWEALLRWQHPEQGLLPPDRFIPLAEETGLIVPIGRWGLREACRQARAWQERRSEGPPLVMCVNLSARQFQDPQLAADVATILAETGWDAAQLQLEITEGVIMEDAEATIATLRRLKGFGVQLAIDDFGTGYSSLGYLKRFPLDWLKIDKLFVAGVGVDTEDSAIVGAIASMAHALGLGLVAEGVETAGQIAYLQRAGCALAQGYFFARPGPPAAIEALLDRRELDFRWSFPLPTMPGEGEEAPLPLAPSASAAR